MPIQLVPYNPEWPLQFEEVRAELAPLLRDHPQIHIEHVGSTSVVGLSGKPIIDVVLGVEHGECVTAAVSALKGLGYEHWHSVEIRRSFVRRNAHGDPTIHVHLVELDGPSWTSQIRFRDHLRTHEEDCRAYAALKKELANRYDDTQAYSEAKTSFIQNILSS